MTADIHPTAFESIYFGIFTHRYQFLYQFRKIEPPRRNVAQYLLVKCIYPHRNIISQNRLFTIILYSAAVFYYHTKVNLYCSLIGGDRGQRFMLQMRLDKLVKGKVR